MMYGASHPLITDAVNYPAPRTGLPASLLYIARRPRVEGGAPRAPGAVSTKLKPSDVDKVILKLHGLQGRFPPRSPRDIEGCAVVAIRGPAAPGTDEDAVGELQILPRGRESSAPKSLMR